MTITDIWAAIATFFVCLLAVMCTSCEAHVPDVETVGVLRQDCGDRTYALGTAWVYGDLLITANHVVDCGDSATWGKSNVEVCARHEMADIAALRLPEHLWGNEPCSADTHPMDVVCAITMDVSRPEVGPIEKCGLVLHPVPGEPWSMYSSAYPGIIRGNSGSPVINEDGCVVGVVTRARYSVDGTLYIFETGIEDVVDACHE